MILLGKSLFRRLIIIIANFTPETRVSELTIVFIFTILLFTKKVKAEISHLALLLIMLTTPHFTS